MGAAAIMWSPRDSHGRRRVIARASAAIPTAGSATLAEAWGLGIGLDLVIDSGGNMQERRVAIYGDNLAVIRFAAGTGHIKDAHAHALLADPLARLRAAGRTASWQAVRRRFNKAADADASAARDRASALAKEGSTAVISRCAVDPGP